MLIQAVGHVLPAAIAVALSPIPIIAVVIVLGTPRARTVGPAFALGWVVGLAAVSTVVVLLAHGASDPDSSTATGVNWFQVAVGVLFLVMAARQWRKRPKHGEPADEPAWMATVDTITPLKAVLLGLALSAANPKNLALTAAAAASIAQAGLDAAETAVAVAAFVVLGSVTVAGSVLLYVVAPRRAERPLAGIKQFMADHSAVIMMVVLLLMGAKLLGDGLGAVWH
jgi:threonine/homoserine/homoserine lactone efflux protein